MIFDINADYVGQLARVDGIHHTAVVLRTQTIAGGGPARHRLEVWFPEETLPVVVPSELVTIVGRASFKQLEHAESQRATYRAARLTGGK